MTTILSFIVVIGVLILIHELGHFLVARWMGVGVERFSIGLGPVLLRWKGKETEYCLSAIPFGGYVKMMGEESPLEAGGGGTTDPDKSFPLKPLPARFLIVFAGPAMNFVLAAVIFAGLFVFVGRPVLPPVLGPIAPDGPAAQARLQPGDRVVAAGGRSVAHWDDLWRAIQDSSGETIQVTVERGGRQLTVAVTPTRSPVRDVFGDERQVWGVGARPHVPAKIAEVFAGDPAAEAGLQSGDTVTALDGTPIATWDDLAIAIRERPGKEVRLTIDRGEQTVTVPVTPRPVKERTLTGEEIEIGRIGIRGASSLIYVRSNPIRATSLGVARTAEITALTVVGLWKLVTGQLPASTLGGPIQIAVLAGEQAKQGVMRLAFFTAVISVNLAILNLLPVPVLDGGHLLFFAIEGLMGRPLSVRKRELAQQVGMAL
ncbi:MAG: RIP metalloprotease RseP, partial [Anaerolineae bacterium]